MNAPFLILRWPIMKFSKLDLISKESSGAVNAASNFNHDVAHASIEMLRACLQERMPRAVLQIGAGSLESTLAVCEALDLDAGAMLTLVEPAIYSDASCRTVLDALQHHGYDSSVEVVANFADQALPDFFFQEQGYDLAVLNPSGDADQNFITLYYLGKLLPKNALLMVYRAEDESIRPWLRRLVVENRYRVLPKEVRAQELPFLEKILRDRYQRLPARLRSVVEDRVRSEVILPDHQLGLVGSFVVLEKLDGASAEAVDVEQMIAELV
ncbi:hypothetical protein HDN1F_00240 [gamma proteobacterium HdN1]|nr:hypothetical protein HDN1F_00240 [gamma proteobacterium HdN1]